MELKKDILLFINSLQGGGSERVCTTIANSLAQKNFNVNLLVLHSKNAVFEKDLDKKVKLTSLNKLHTRKAFFAVAKYLLQNKPKKIIVFNYQLAIMLVILRAVLFLDYYIISRNINVLSKLMEHEKSFWHKYIVDFFTKLFYKKSDKFIAQSNGMRDDLINSYKVKKEKIIVINNPVNERIESLAKTLDFNKISKKYEVLFIGALEKRKGLDYLLDSFKIISKTDNKIKLRILGKGSLKSKLIQKTEDLHLENQVIFEDFKKDVTSYILQSRATLLTSLHEGFPNVLVESITLGTPVVSFDCPSGPSEIIDNGKNGYLVEYLNVEKFAQAVLKIINQNIDSLLVAKSAERFYSDKIMMKYIEILE